MAGSGSEGEALVGGFGFGSKTAEFLRHHIPSFGQFRDAEPSCSLSLGTEGEGGDYWGHFSSPATSTRAATAPCSSFMGDSKLICKLFPKSGIDQRRLPLENAHSLCWLSPCPSTRSSIPSASSCRTGAVAWHTEPFLPIFYLFKLNLAKQLQPSRVPGLLCPHHRHPRTGSRQAQPWEVSPSWPASVTQLPEVTRDGAW